MFKAKPHSPKPPWTIQVLTPDYLVDGSLDPEKNDSDITSIFTSDDDDKEHFYLSLHLTAARFQSAHNPAAPAGYANDWFVPVHMLAALIPRDEDSTAYVVKNNTPEKLVPADIYVGPYIIHGTILNPDEEFSILGDYLNFVVRDAVIELPFTGAKLPELNAPLAIVRTHLVQGIVVRA